MLLLIKNLHEKNIIEKGKTKETLTARVLIMICTRVTTFNSCYNFQLVLQLYTRVTTLHSCYNFYTIVTILHSCYNFTLMLQLYTRVTWKMHSFSAKGVILFMYKKKNMQRKHLLVPGININTYKFPKI